MTFNRDGAINSAIIQIAERRQSQNERLDREQAEAIACVEEYANHLAAGGDAGKHPEPPVATSESRWSQQSSRLISYKDALGIVYAEWNEARGERANPFSPLDFLKRWRLAEYALDHLGETMLYAELGDLGARKYDGTRMQSSEVVSILAELQDTNGRDLILRRVRIDGKVAYLLRLRQAMEESVGYRDDDNRLRGVDATKIPLEKKTAASHG